MSFHLARASTCLAVAVALWGCNSTILPAGADAGPEDAGGDEIRTLSQSVSQTILDGNSVACLDATMIRHLDNRYFRIYDLAQEGITRGFSVTNVTVGIERATAGNGDGQQTGEVRLHAVQGAAALENFVQLAATNVLITDQDRAVLNVNIQAEVPGSSMLAVEFFTPDSGDTLNDIILLGSNNMGQSGLGYVVAPGCSIDLLTPLENIAQGMHIILNVSGRASL